MTIADFNTLTTWIMRETGLNKSAAGDIAAEIGDTPPEDVDGLWKLPHPWAEVRIRVMPRGWTPEA